MSTNVIMLAGDLSIDILDEDGNSTGFQQLEADVLKITPKSKTVESTSKGRATYGQPFAQVVVPDASEFELRLTEITRQVLATMMAGTIQSVTQAAGALPSVSIKAILDRFVEIGTMQLASAKVTNAAGDVTYQQGIDYDLDNDLGMIRAIPGGAIKTGDHISVTPTALAYSGDKISGATRHQYKLVIKLNGRNLANNENVIFEARQAVVAPTDAQDFLDDKLMNATLKGTLNVPARGAAPFTLTVINKS